MESIKVKQLIIGTNFYVMTNMRIMTYADNCNDLIVTMGKQLDNISIGFEL